MQLYAAYSEGCSLRDISTIIGVEALTERDKIYLAAANWFENEFLSQGEFERRIIENTLDIGWRLFSILPEEELKLISEELIKKHLPEHREKT